MRWSTEVLFKDSQQVQKERLAQSVTVAFDILERMIPNPGVFVLEIPAQNSDLFFLSLCRLELFIQQRALNFEYMRRGIDIKVEASTVDHYEDVNLSTKLNQQDQPHENRRDENLHVPVR
ncbi:hypothetical protein F1728_16140 [Gimesia benthica]|uniref:Uncharacterized protein n=1 Tax=Gimesia benthica TaxID=2608982 RepID=A0A6I6ADP4_9PLAN|nr:hypothetical protein [Gimesia benthica]QGQ24126.1 hypothetical protein F1728_16140 [Gimesia benthica]